MSNSDEAFTVYYRRHGSRRWQQRDLASIDAATEWIASNLAEEDQVYLYENNVWFTLRGEARPGDVVFWWNDACLVEMEQEPQGRGFGWSDDYECFVRYDREATRRSFYPHQLAR